MTLELFFRSHFSARGLNCDVQFPAEAKPGQRPKSKAHRLSFTVFRIKSLCY